MRMRILVVKKILRSLGQAICERFKSPKGMAVDLNRMVGAVSFLHINWWIFDTG